MNSIPSRDKIKIGISVQIVQKQDQSTGNLTEGTIKRILTSSNFHPHGIKVELDNGKIGRVQNIIHKWRQTSKVAIYRCLNCNCLLA